MRQDTDRNMRSCNSHTTNNSELKQQKIVSTLFVVKKQQIQHLLLPKERSPALTGSCERQGIVGSLKSERELSFDLGGPRTKAYMFLLTAQKRGKTWMKLRQRGNYRIQRHLWLCLYYLKLKSLLCFSDRAKMLFITFIV